MPSSHSPDRLVVGFDDDHAVANAALVPATLAARLGMDRLVDLGDRPGAHRPGRKVLTLVHAMVAGGDCIDDADVLPTAQTAQVLGPGSWRHRRWAGSCARSPSATSANSTRPPSRSFPGRGPLAPDLGPSR